MVQRHNVRYTSKTVCLSFFCKFIKFAHTSNGDFYKNFCLAFLCIPRVVLFNVTYFGHSTTKNSLKYQIWNFASWVDKMSQKRAIFLKIAQVNYLSKIAVLLQNIGHTCICIGIKQYQLTVRALWHFFGRAVALKLRCFCLFICLFVCLRKSIQSDHSDHNNFFRIDFLPSESSNDCETEQMLHYKQKLKMRWVYYKYLMHSAYCTRCFWMHEGTHALTALFSWWVNMFYTSCLVTFQKH